MFSCPNSKIKFPTFCTWFNGFNDPACSNGLIKRFDINDRTIYMRQKLKKRNKNAIWAEICLVVTLHWGAGKCQWCSEAEVWTWFIKMYLDFWTTSTRRWIFDIQGEKYGILNLSTYKLLLIKRYLLRVRIHTNHLFHFLIFQISGLV